MAKFELVTSEAPRIMGTNSTPAGTVSACTQTELLQMGLERLVLLSESFEERRQCLGLSHWAPQDHERELYTSGVRHGLHVDTTRISGKLKIESSASKRLSIIAAADGIIEACSIIKSLLECIGCG